MARNVSRGQAKPLCFFFFLTSFILFPERAGRHRLSLICHFVHGQQDQRDGGRGWLHLRHERKLSVNHVDIFAADVAALRLTQSWKRNIYKMRVFHERIERSFSVGLSLAYLFPSDIYFVLCSGLNISVYKDYFRHSCFRICFLARKALWCCQAASLEHDRVFPRLFSRLTPPLTPHNWNSSSDGGSEELLTVVKISSWLWVCGLAGHGCLHKRWWMRPWVTASACLGLRSFAVTPWPQRRLLVYPSEDKPPSLSSSFFHSNLSSLRGSVLYIKCTRRMLGWSGTLILELFFKINHGSDLA